ncbi:hypothetical protein H4S06_000733 [Coemansia sp. BCRC 34490]|nr:hypothetical protein H4S06_000733 [Coemansia sp. BCRC 34490]
MAKTSVDSFLIHVPSNTKPGVKTTQRIQVVTKYNKKSMGAENGKGCLNTVDIVAVDPQNESKVFGAIQATDLGNGVAGLSLVAVHSDCCGNGVGRSLVEHGERFVATSPEFIHCRHIVVKTRPDMLEYYKDLGYLSRDNVSGKPDNPYCLMHKRVFRGPPAFNHKL